MLLQKRSSSTRLFQLAGFAVLMALCSTVLCCTAHAQSAPQVANDEFRGGSQPLQTGKVTGSGEAYGVNDLRESMTLYDVYSVDANTTKLTYQLEAFNAKTGQWELYRTAESTGSRPITFSSYAGAVESGECLLYWIEFLMMYRVITILPPDVDWRLEDTFDTRGQAEDYADFLEEESNFRLLTKIESRNRLDLSSP